MNHDEIKLSEFTDFEWDVAYIDREYYRSGQQLKEKYNIQGEFELMHSDFNSRIAFCMKGNLVEDVIFVRTEKLDFDISIEIFYPETVFTVEWETLHLTKDYKKLVLTEKNTSTKNPTPS